MTNDAMMGTYLAGFPDIQIVPVASGAGGTVTCTLRPADNRRQWVVTHIAVINGDDSGARNAILVGYDGTNTFSLKASTSVAASGNVPFAPDCGMPIKINYTHYLQAIFYSVAASKTMSIVGWIHEVPEG